MDAPTPTPSWLVAIQYLLFAISNFGVLVPLAIGLWRWRILAAPAKIMVGYFGFWSIEAFVDLWSRKVLHTNIYLYHVTVLVETWLLGWAYYHTYDLKPVRRAMLPVGAAFTLVALADAFWISGLDHLNNVARVVQVALMLTMILLYFEQWVRDIRTDNPWRNLMFMTSVGLSVYYTGSVMSYLMHQMGTSGGIADTIMSVIIDSTYAVGLVLMTLGLWRETRPQPNPKYDSNIFA